MTGSVNVALRHYQGEDPQWEAYGINDSFYGSGDELAQAREDARNAAALLLDIPEDFLEINEYHEHLVRLETESEPAVWVRTRQDDDVDLMLGRRHVRDYIAEYLKVHPERMNTFTQGSGAMGDVVATVMFPNEPLRELIQQFGDSQRLYVAVPGPNNAIYWQCISEPGLPDSSPDTIALRDLPLSESSTIWDFMEMTGANVNVAGNVVLAAA